MRAAGMRRFGGEIEMLDLPEPRGPAHDEVLIRVHAAGCGVWEDYVRTGDWDTGARPPMALGVEGSGVVVSAGDAVTDIEPGDEVLTYPLDLRGSGAWAELLLAPAAMVARKPSQLTWAQAAVLPAPGMTALQVVEQVLRVQSGDRVLVSGAGGVTGGLLVQVAALAGARVVATAGPASNARVRSYGAAEVIDYHDPDWPRQARELLGGGANAAANAAPGSAAAALQVVVDGGRLATITEDAPPAERDITVSGVILRTDGADLARAAALAGSGHLRIDVAVELPVERAAEALAHAAAGAGGAVVLIVGHD
jgi:NADPH:quinone reductase-like Zn-dependent oxidoreductase